MTNKHIFIQFSISLSRSIEYMLIVSFFDHWLTEHDNIGKQRTHLSRHFSVE